MLPERIHPQTTRGTRATLHLNGTCVGDIEVYGGDASWAYGRFTPGESFGDFAPVFGRWSLLMHADEREPLSRAASEELREAERQMDAVKARVFFPGGGGGDEVAQLNIGGDLIEWKEF